VVQPPMLRAMMFEQSPQAMVVYDWAMRVIECNDALARVFGTTRNRIIGLHIDDLRDRRFRTPLERHSNAPSLARQHGSTVSSSEPVGTAALSFARANKAGSSTQRWNTSVPLSATTLKTAPCTA
jgi:PAS domain-containing protein